jgi:hypothetical protein
MKISTLTLCLVSVIIVNSACNNPAKEQVNEQVTVKETQNDSTTPEAKVLPEKGPFEPTLELKNISFDIHTTGSGSIKKLNVQSHGLENDQKFIHPVCRKWFLRKCDSLFCQ